MTVNDALGVNWECFQCLTFISLFFPAPQLIAYEIKSVAILRLITLLVLLTVQTQRLSHIIALCCAFLQITIHKRSHYKLLFQGTFLNVTKH